MKAYIVQGDKELTNFFQDLEITTNLSEAKLVIFGDGPIVSPSLYKEKKNSQVSLKCDINRDRSDKSIYTKLKPDQIAIGINRGACFLAIMNGAKLVQYSYKRNPESSYMINFKSNDKIYCFTGISDWVQSINLLNCDSEDYNLLAISKESMDYLCDNETKRFMQFNGDPELIKFHRKNCPISICIQFHPEWMPESHLSKIVKNLIYECANS